MQKILIIGAGPAGLTAAHELLKTPGAYEVTVLEGSDAIGGISRTVRYAGNRMDIGGHRFFSRDERVMEWWRNVMPLQGAPSSDDLLLGRPSVLAEGGPDPEKGDRVMLVRKRVSRIYYQGKFFDYPISMKWQTFRNMGLLQTMRAGFSYLYSAVHKLPDDSLENFYINRFGRVLYSMFFEGYTEKVWGRHPSRISADWGAQRVKGLSIRAILKDMFGKLFLSPAQRKARTETSLIEEFWYPKFGPGHLWESVAKEVEARGGRIEMETCAKEILTKDGRICGVRCENGSVYDCDVLISSMPLRELIAGMPDAPAPVKTVAQGLPYRDFVTVGLLVPKLNLKNETSIPTVGGIVPDCWIYVQDTNVKLGRIQIFNNWSPYLVADPAHTVWIGLEYFCNEGDALWSMDEDAMVRLAEEELVRIGVITSADDVLDAHRERVYKAYPAYFDTYAQIDEAIGYLSGYENLYCVGRNGQHRYNNMDHSMATAFEAVENIRTGRADKENVWNVNTEQSYHEEKKA